MRRVMTIDVRQGYPAKEILTKAEVRCRCHGHSRQGHGGPRLSGECGGARSEADHKTRLCHSSAEGGA